MQSVHVIKPTCPRQVVGARKSSFIVHVAVDARVHDAVASPPSHVLFSSTNGRRPYAFYAI
jgi:hypothetical protein